MQAEKFHCENNKKLYGERKINNFDNIMSSSINLQIMLYLTSFYFGMFLICEFGVLIFKGIHLPYPEGGLFLDGIILVLLAAIESFRILEGQKGNLISPQGKVSIVVSMGLCAPSVLAVLYFVLWQHYVLRLEVILCIIQLVLQVLEFFVSFSVLADDRLNIRAD